jgi:site-specific DNA recombinase
VRYRYYVSRSAHHEGRAEGMRIPAREIESLVTNRVAALFEDPLALLSRIAVNIAPASVAPVFQRCTEFAATLKGSQRSGIADLLHEVRIEAAHIEIDIRSQKLAAMLGVCAGEGAPPRSP